MIFPAVYQTEVMKCCNDIYHVKAHGWCMCCQFQALLYNYSHMIFLMGLVKSGIERYDLILHIFHYIL